MTKIVWDNNLSAPFGSGIDRGVLFPIDLDGSYGTGVSWSGLCGVKETPNGAELRELFVDNEKIFGIILVEEYEALIEAVTYPKEFSQSLGFDDILPGLSIRLGEHKRFGFCFRSIIPNTDSYVIHVVYSLVAGASENTYRTISNDAIPIVYGWRSYSTPVEMKDMLPVSSITIDSRMVSKSNMNAVEEILYGTTLTEPRLPMPDELFVVLSPVFIVGQGIIGSHKIGG